MSANRKKLIWDLRIHHFVIRIPSQNCERKELAMVCSNAEYFALHFFCSRETSIPWYLCAHKFYRLSAQIRVWNGWTPIFPVPDQNLINWPCLICFKFEIMQEIYYHFDNMSPHFPVILFQNLRLLQKYKIKWSLA